jgi:hydroxymethylpyrimidine pyrophosphatase-like HAD family hydrolase
MHYVVLAADYDGTIAPDGRVAPATVAALERFAASGRKLVLVTGRELDELLAVFPAIGVFDRVVAENGALLYVPATGKRRALGEPPPALFVRELERRGVVPLSVGESIVATVHPHETVVLQAIRDLGLELQVIFNKGAVMVVPASINKASGLKAALDELGLSARNAVAIGDAENDHALLREAEYGVAVANALPMLKREADHVSAHPSGAAVIELVDDLIALDPGGPAPRGGRRRLRLGARADGAPVEVPAAWSGVLVAGPPGSGRSPLAKGLLERVCAHGYQACVIDPDGRYGGFADAIVFGTPERAPTTDEVLTALEQPEATAIVSLAAVQRASRTAFVGELAARLAALRASAGRPHWIVVDEAHELLAGAAAAEGLATARGLIYVTSQPAALPASALAGVDAAIALGETPRTAIEAIARATGRAAPVVADGARRAGDALAWLTRTGEAVWIRPARAAPAEDRRHRRQPAVPELPPERSFYFRGPEAKLNLRAQSLPLFLQLAEGVDEGTWTHHLARGDYSAWLRKCVEDDALADEVAAVERAAYLAPRESRARVRAAVEGRYELPASAGGETDR